jgi:hypothetical protein
MARVTHDGNPLEQRGRGSRRDRFLRPLVAGAIRRRGFRHPSRPRDGFPYEVWHVGSTAVPGLAAKPIIDIVLAVADRERWPGLVEPLARLD